MLGFFSICPHPLVPRPNGTAWRSFLGFFLYNDTDQNLLANGGTPQVPSAQHGKLYSLQITHHARRDGGTTDKKNPELGNSGKVRSLMNSKTKTKKIHRPRGRRGFLAYMPISIFQNPLTVYKNLQIFAHSQQRKGNYLPNFFQRKACPISFSALLDSQQVQGCLYLLAL